MFTTNNSNTQKPSSSATTTNTTDRSTQQQSSYNPNQQQASTQGPTSQQKSSTQPTRATEPYPTQDSTWWEEAPSPNTHRMEQGYGRGGGMGGHEQRQEYGQYSGRSRDERRARENQGVINWNKVAKIICAVFLPPLGVFLETGCDKSFAINVLLTILGYLPGIIHAIYVIFTD